MSDEEEMLDAIVVGFDEEGRIIASLTSGGANIDLSRLKGMEAQFEDTNGVIWRGRIIEVHGDALVIDFGEKALSAEEGASGLGQGSMIRIPKP